MNTDVNSQTTTTAPTGPLGGPLLFSLAHPDDESFGSGGTIALATSLGVPVTILSATRGERGETAIEGIDSPQTLGAVREEELRREYAAEHGEPLGTRTASGLLVLPHQEEEAATDKEEPKRPTILLPGRDD